MLRTLFIRTTRIRTTTPLISRRITRLIMTDSTAKMPSPPPAAGGAGEEPLSKSALKKLEKDKEKAKKKAEREAKELQEKQTREANQVDYAVQNYGNQTLNQSQERNNFSWAKIDQLTVDQVGERVRIQARVHNSRSQSAKLCFLVLRQQTSTIQTILSMTETTVSKQMIKYAIGIPLESIVIVEGIIQKPIEDIKTCTVSKLEIKLDKIFVLAEAPAKLPFLLEDASRPVDLLPKEGEQFVTVGTDTRLDNRVLDLRTPVNQAIFRVQSRVCNLFRSYLDEQDFIEIHTPKIQGAATESGSSVFKLAYFDQTAFLAQSPQLAKQMAIAADFDRVYEIGPVFRAENSNTYRHMTEFIGLDLEMTIKEHYHETIDLLDGLFLHIFKGLQSNSTKEIQTIKSQFPLDDFKFLDKTLRLNHNDAIQILIDNGHDIQIGQDMGTEQERILGKLIKDKYQTDYYIIDKFPLAIRPFYTMPDPVDPTLSNSYDFFMRGEEIISGAQRIHEPNLLIERMKEAKIDPGEMKGYLDGFRLGCPAHAGGGIGLERVIMLFFGLGNIRRACLFPRDPKRLHP
ncbi:hypothetical protein MJO28_016073 [Puccinia striiformis f. sp. tritici]|uniref:Aspartate--tRNA ligase, cytoplasmic n=2 Tax=Puccinia striiformis f. sp. tritici TaxID=168172 RepID=A0A0L0W1T1_9BASI|nr:hypothetical protein Pst134EA_028897 [Puccinia striiformis f. sp. tritici]KNF05488.1 aspartyl-tRNA synthetase [Puccinia striiformis f. sp. tritici PST-78]KAH9440959.1 hypothetical protein Pst134EB_029610 [Puccinia striiformis f. sp. tritici]KAH9446911.1 hypothetical protein Pst134EA_028897 [Puccinia striiformis f. sp. tritici]KAI7936020.1 hypothetical protein MJO29_015323 [Puccinia striiformis f. sp. tritici]KAI7936022.1 hypothetical protein MJO29_015325 [Puccinia striiformis f. sp. tritici